VNSAVLERGKGKGRNFVSVSWDGLPARFNNGRAVGWIARPDALLWALGHASSAIWEMLAVECVGFAAICLC
jgi:hypothetical protein